MKVFIGQVAKNKQRGAHDTIYVCIQLQSVIHSHLLLLDISALNPPSYFDVLVWWGLKHDRQTISAEHEYVLSVVFYVEQIILKEGKYGSKDVCLYVTSLTFFTCLTGVPIVS